MTPCPHCGCNDCNLYTASNYDRLAGPERTLVPFRWRLYHIDQLLLAAIAGGLVLSLGLAMAVSFRSLVV